jgi:hypothetical protein
MCCVLCEENFLSVGQGVNDRCMFFYRQEKNPGLIRRQSPSQACTLQFLQALVKSTGITAEIPLLLAKPRGCPWQRPWFFADIALLFTCHTCMHLLLNFQHWRLAKNQGFSEGIPLCCMPAVVLGIFPGKFARGFKPLSKSLAKGHYSCSDSLRTCRKPF